MCRFLVADCGAARVGAPRVFSLSAAQAASRARSKKYEITTRDYGANIMALWGLSGGGPVAALELPGGAAFPSTSQGTLARALIADKICP